MSRHPVCETRSRGKANSPMSWSSAASVRWCRDSRDSCAQAPMRRASAAVRRPCPCCHGRAPSSIFAACRTTSVSIAGRSARGSGSASIAWSTPWMHRSADSVLLARVDDMAVLQKKAQDLGDLGLWVENNLWPLSIALTCGIDPTRRLLVCRPSTAVPRPTSHTVAPSS